MATKIDPSTSSATLEKLETVDAIIDATTARRKASAYVAAHIGDALMGVNPTFVPGEHPVWRVPIVLAYVSVGTLGEVGSIDVDAANGTVSITEVQANSIKQAAIALAKRSPSVARR